MIDAKTAVGDLLFVLANQAKTKFPDDVWQNTPRRVAEAYAEMLSGYHDDPKEILSKRFTENVSGMQVQGPIEFTSLCEHHLLPFEGVAFVSYISFLNKVVGLSKLSRLVYCYARRLQLQERMTAQITDALERYLSPDCAVLTISTHGCMKCRGVMNHTPSSWAEVRGRYLRKPAVKEEFFKRVELNWRLDR